MSWDAFKLLQSNFSVVSPQSGIYLEINPTNLLLLRQGFQHRPCIACALLSMTPPCLDGCGFSLCCTLFHFCSILSPFSVLCHFCFRLQASMSLFLFLLLVHPLFSFPVVCSSLLTDIWILLVSLKAIWGAVQLSVVCSTLSQDPGGCDPD